MIPEIGHFCLILALCVAVVQGTLPLVGAQQGRREWIALARPTAQAGFLLTAAAFACLTWSFYVSDFSITYVAQHSNSQLPTLYRVAAVWGGHEGSLLLWVLMLAGWAFAVAQLSRTLDAAMVARVLGAALLSGKLDAAWARWSRPWTMTAWVFLTLGIALGSWWAYYELGWGGWWFWDPVENASFMPWLVGTALIHSLAVTEKRGSFKNWTVLLAISAFSLSLLGTFLVRSGVLTSVHAFATDPRRGIFILILLVLVIGSSLLLFAWRAPKVSLGGAFALMSRETLLLIGNVLLVVAAGSVLLGTLYPLIIDALNLGKLSVGPPYFNAVFVPIMAPLVFLMATGPVARWKHATLKDIVKRLRIAAVLAVLAGAAIPALMGGWTLLTGLGSLLAVWVASSVTLQLVERRKAGRPSPSFWAMQLGHLGVAVFVTGITLVGGYQDERDVRMEPGDTTTVGGYSFKFNGVRDVPGPNYKAAQGDFDLIRDGKPVKKLYPEKRSYFSSSMPMTEAAIDPGFTRDVYVSLGEPLEGRAWSVRVYYKPFVNWIWGGCLLMALGGLFAVSDRRYRLKFKSAAVGAAALGGAAS